MSVFTVIFVIGFLGVIIGIKKSWLGGIAGALIASLFFHSGVSLAIAPAVIGALVLFLFGSACGMACSIALSGLKGGGHNVGPTYISGFGAHHPGGIILSDEECNAPKGSMLKHIVVFNY